MSILASLRPTQRNRIYDLVREAGVDVTDWEVSRKKAKSAAANPKYCYNWSFVEPGKVVVLNLWHSDMEERVGVVSDEWNAREIARRSRGVTVRRARTMDEAIQAAYHNALPVRVVVCEGTKRNRNDPASGPSRVSRRLLDPEPWHVASYDDATGESVLRRGINGAEHYVDQFDMPAPTGGPTRRVVGESSSFFRRPEVRRFALLRAKGKCEYCGGEGFQMTNGRIYLETHHIVPLHQGGDDTPSNVAALCPNHHREAHHGKQQAAIRRRLSSRLASQ